MAIEDVPFGQRGRGEQGGGWQGAWRCEERRSRGVGRRARGLGWLSVGLGLAELARPRQVAQAIGVCATPAVRSTLIGLGLRELLSGVGILARPRPAPWLLSRFAGDLMDLALLGRAFLHPNSDRKRVAAATAAVAGVTLFDAFTGFQARGYGAAGKPLFGREIRFRRSITINRPTSEVYAFWRDFKNLGTFMAHLESVEPIDTTRSRWRAKAPAGMTVAWEAEIVDDVPERRIAWRSIEGAQIANSGVVEFEPAPGGRGTEVCVEIAYRPPGGRLGAAVARLFGEEPGQQVEGDLRRLKQLLETGEITQSDASIHEGRHPAQPGPV